MDTNGDGMLDRAELIAAARSGALPEGGDEAQLDAAIAKMDTDGDGKISRDEWLAFFTKMVDIMSEMANM